MHADSLEMAWISETHGYSLAQIAALAGTSEELLCELVDCGAMAPLPIEGSHWVFAGATVTTLRTACRLGADLELDPQGVAVALSLLERIRCLDAELAALRARQPG